VDGLGVAVGGHGWVELVGSGAGVRSSTGGGVVVLGGAENSGAGSGLGVVAGVGVGTVSSTAVTVRVYAGVQLVGGIGLVWAGSIGTVSVVGSGRAESTS